MICKEDKSEFPHFFFNLCKILRIIKENKNVQVTFFLVSDITDFE